MKVYFFSTSPQMLLLYSCLFMATSCQKNIVSSDGTEDFVSRSDELGNISQVQLYQSNLVMDKLTFDSIQVDLQQSVQARELIQNQVTVKANAALGVTPTPVSQISRGSVEDLVRAEAERVYVLGLQYFLFQGASNSSTFVNKAKDFLLAWAAINSPTIETPQETAYLGFQYGYSLIRNQIDVNSRTTIDNWFRSRFQYYKGRPVRNNNWETIRALFLLNIGYLLDDSTLINEATTVVNAHHNRNYRADGNSLDFIGRDAFAYHVYDLSFIGQIGRTLYIKKGRSEANTFVYHRGTNWITPRTNYTGPVTLGGALSDAIDFMKPYIVEPTIHIHLEFVNTEYAPDKQRSDYNKPFTPSGASYGLIEVSAVMKNEMTALLKVIKPDLTRYNNGLTYYFNSFGVSAENPDTPRAVVYGDGGYLGWYKEIEEGQYSLADLTNRGIPNDKISSIYIPKGYKVTLYEHGSFQGKSLVLSSNTGDLSKLGFNDQTSSLKIERN